MTASVNGYQKVTASAFYLYVYLIVVAKDYGAHVEAVRRYRCERYRVALRDDDGASHTERIRCGACWGAYNESVSLVGGEIFTIYACADAYH